MTIINDFVPLPGWVGVYLKDDGGFSSKYLPGVTLEYHDDSDDSDDEDENFFAIMPASFVPMGTGIEPDTKAFGFVHEKDFSKYYAAAKWDIQNVSTDVVVDDDGVLQPITTFSIAVTNDTELNVYDGIGVDAEVLPGTTKFLIAESQHLALEDYQRAIGPAEHDTESE